MTDTDTDTDTDADAVRFLPGPGGSLVGTLGDCSIAVWRHAERIDAAVTDAGARAHVGMYASEAGFKKQLRIMVSEGHDGTFAQKRLRWSADARRLAQAPWRIGETRC